MLGRNHVALSIASALLLATPWLPGSLPIVALILAGVWIGAFLPDMDTDGMRVVRGVVMPRILVRILRWILFRIVGIAFRLVRQPFHPEHRGSLHTLLGIGFYSLVISFSIFAGLRIVGFWDPVVLYFFAGLVAGGLLHLLEDCCTRWGVTPFVPLWEHRFHGGISTGNSSDKRPEIYASILFTITGGLYYFSLTQQIAQIQMIKMAGLIFLTVWGMFYAISKFKIRNKSRRT